VKNFWHRWDVGSPPSGGVEFDCILHRRFVGTNWAWWFDEQWRWVCCASFFIFSAEEDYCLVKTLPVEVDFDGAKDLRQRKQRELLDHAKSVAEFYADNKNYGIWNREIWMLRPTIETFAKNGLIKPTRYDRCRWFVHRFWFDHDEQYPDDMSECVRYAVWRTDLDEKSVIRALEAIELPKYLKTIRTTPVKPDLDIYIPISKNGFTGGDLNDSKDLQRENHCATQHKVGEGNVPGSPSSGARRERRRARNLGTETGVEVVQETKEEET
jgi:hypothetical protein